MTSWRGRSSRSSSSNELSEMFYWQMLCVLLIMLAAMVASYDGTGGLHKYRFDETGQLCENQLHPLKPCHEGY